MGFGLNIGGFASGVESGVGAYRQLQEGQLEKQRAGIEQQKFDLDKVLTDYNITALKNKQNSYIARQHFDTATNLLNSANRPGLDPAYAAKLRDLAHQHTQQALGVSFSDAMPKGFTFNGLHPTGQPDQYAVGVQNDSTGEQNVLGQSGKPYPVPQPGQPVPPEPPLLLDGKTAAEHTVAAKAFSKYVLSGAPAEQPQAPGVQESGVETAPVGQASKSGPGLQELPNEPAATTTPPAPAASATPASTSPDSGLGLPQATPTAPPAADLSGQAAAPVFAGSTDQPAAGGLPSDSQLLATAGAGADSAAPQETPQPTAPPAAAAPAQGATGMPQKLISYDDPNDDPDVLKAQMPLHESIDDAAERHKFEYQKQLYASRGTEANRWAEAQQLAEQNGTTPGEEYANLAGFTTKENIAKTQAGGRVAAAGIGAEARKYSADAGNRNAVVRADALLKSAEVRAMAPAEQYQFLLDANVPEDIAGDRVWGHGRQQATETQQEGATGRTQMQETGKNARQQAQIGATADLQTQKDAAVYAREQLKTGGKDASDKSINTILKQAQTIRESTKVTDKDGNITYGISLKNAIEAASQTYDVLKEAQGGGGAAPPAARSAPAAKANKGMLEGVMPKPPGQRVTGAGTPAAAPVFTRAQVQQEAAKRGLTEQQITDQIKQKGGSVGP